MTLSEKIYLLSNLKLIGTYDRGLIHSKDVKEFIKEQAKDLKVLFCTNPDVQFCGECWACRGVDHVNKNNAGVDLI